MKKILLILATASLALSGLAGNTDDKKKNVDPDKYCAEFKDGVLHVVHNGEPLVADVTLENGTIIHTDATIHKKDGTVTVMKPDECVNVDGSLEGDTPADKGFKRNKKSKDPLDPGSEQKSPEKFDPKKKF